MKDEEAFNSIKIKGSPSELGEKAKQLESTSTIGLAECSREERCKASSITASPSSNNLFAVAIDGEIENFESLKKWSNEPFPIATEEDLLLACLCIMNKDNKIELISAISKSLAGNPSFAFISKSENAIYCKSGKSQLIIGTSPNGVFLSSELNALLPFCEKYTVLNSGESAVLSQNKLLIFDSKQKRIKKAFISVGEKSYFVNDYLLADEIYYCPLAVKETYNHFVKNQELDFGFLKLSRRYIDRINKIIIVGSNVSKNTAFLCRHLFETLCTITTIAFDSYEFNCSDTPIDKNTILIAISHRGESKSTIECVKKAKEMHAKTIAVTSNKNSALARESDFLINPYCDFESSSISLRSFISSYLSLCFFALYLGERINIVSKLYLGVCIKISEMLSGKISSVIKSNPGIEKAASLLAGAENIYVTGLGADFALSLEASQKIREIAKKNAFSLCLDDLSEYPKELIASSRVIALITNKELSKKAMKSLRRIKSRGAEVIIITSEGIEEDIEDFENIVTFNDSLPVFNPIPCISCVYKIALLADEEAKNQNTEQSA